MPAINPPIKRAAVLIGASQVGSINPEANPLPGVDLDIQRMRKFLHSDKGGAWESDEIHTISNQDSSAIKNYLQRFFNFDYVFILVAGHGNHLIDTNDTQLVTQPGEYLGIKEMKTFARRQVFVIDVCRELVAAKDLQKRAALSAALNSMIYDSAFGIRQYCRDLFNQQIMQIPEGTYKFFSCDKNQLAEDDGSGGVYTIALLDVAINVSQTSNLRDVHNITKSAVHRTSYPQLPTEEVGRTLSYPPFVVVPLFNRY